MKCCRYVDIKKGLRIISAIGIVWASGLLGIAIYARFDSWTTKLFSSTSLSLTKNRWFDQRIQALPHSHTQRSAVD